jgi:hypothetical protein
MSLKLAAKVCCTQQQERNLPPANCHCQLPNYFE